jgi:phage/plasmid-associated DNA primase
MDGAINKRLRCINFSTEFTTNPIEPNQKKINTRLNENFKLWKADFMLLLIKTYNEYKKNQQLIPTNNILEWTNRYKEQTDIYFNYLSERTEHSDKHIHVSKLFEDFKLWYKTNNPNSKIPSNKDFLQGLKKHKPIEKSVRDNEKVSNGIKNLKIKDDE